MKKFLVLAIILPLIFPVYCFSYPPQGAQNEKSNKLLSDEAIMSDIILIMQDGIIEQSEITSLLENFNGSKTSIKPNECEFQLISVIMSFLGVIQQFFVGDPGTALVMFIYYLYNWTTAISSFQNCVSS